MCLAFKMLRSTCGTRCSAENYSMLALQNRGHVSCFLLYCLSVLVGTSDMGMLLGSRWSYDLKACMMWWSREGLARQGQVSTFSSQKPSSLGFGGISAPPPAPSHFPKAAVQDTVCLAFVHDSFSAGSVLNTRTL